VRKFLGEKGDVILRHQVLSEIRKASVNATGKVEITGLRGSLRKSSGLIG